LGNACFAQQNYTAAMTHYQEVLRLQPQSAEAHYNLANAFKQLNQLDEAIRYFRQALQLNPKLAEAHNNLGIALKRQDRFDEAILSYRKALSLQAIYPEAWANLGNIYGDRGQFDDAMHCYEEALRHDPNHADTHFNRAGQWLLLGDWTRGWPEYEWRWRTRAFPANAFQQPRWDGLSLHGRTLLVTTEQGLGDSMQFVRYVPWLRQRGQRVIFQCPSALRPLLAASLGAEGLVVQGDPLPPFDVFVPLISLPHVLKTTPTTVPNVVPYLRARPDLVDHWRRQLQSLPGFKIGIAWQGNPEYLGDRYRSVALQRFAVLAAVPGVHLISLQKGHGENQLQAEAGQFSVLNLGQALDATAGAFMDTAAIIENLDLVISTDTAIPHLAGALGVPTWIALSYVPDWRWMLGRQDSPWYPTVRLFRQTEGGQWDDVFARMATELRNHQVPGNRIINPPIATAAEHARLGLALAEQGKLTAAANHYREALRLDPNFVRVHNNFGNVLVRQGNPEEAATHYRQALRLQPDHAQAHCNLANVLTSQGRAGQAVIHAEHALRVRPNFGEAHHNLAGALQRMGKLDEALGHYQQARRLQPGNAETDLCLALLQLLGGDFERGWPAYESRWAQPGAARRPFAQPRWDGSDLAGRKILLFAEQGLGDTIQFIRYASLVKERGGKVVVECQPPLHTLLQEVAGVDLLIAQGSALPAIDVQAPLLSLPGILHTTLDTIPATIPYLHANLTLVENWRRELQPIGGFKVGIAWQGRPQYRFDRERSIPLVHFARLADVEEVRLISLQKGTATDQMKNLPNPFPIVDLGPRLDEKAGAFVDTAAVMRNLDLVITSDSAVAHLAGALGVAVWVALPLVPDWRWLLQREDSPWYSTMRLFRQTQYGRWDDVFERMAEKLVSAASGLTPRSQAP